MQGVGWGGVAGHSTQPRGTNHPVLENNWAPLFCVARFSRVGGGVWPRPRGSAQGLGRETISIKERMMKLVETGGMQGPSQRSPAHARM